MNSILEKLKPYFIYLSQRRIGLKSAGAKLIFVILSLYFQYPHFDYIISCLMRKSIEHKLCVLCASAPPREKLWSRKLDVTEY